jgi:hypothetical protein
VTFEKSSGNVFAAELFDDRKAFTSARFSIDLFPSDKQLLHQLVPLGVFFFRFFDAVLLVDVGFFEFLRQ